MINLKTVVTADQQQTGGTDASLIREEMADQVNELVDYNHLALHQNNIDPSNVTGPIADSYSQEEPEQNSVSNQIYTNHF